MASLPDDIISSDDDGNTSVDAGDLTQTERDPTDTQRVDEPDLGGADFEDVDARCYIDGDLYGIVAYRQEYDIGPMASFGKCEVFALGHSNSPDYDSDFEAQVRVNVDEDAQDIPEREEMFNEWTTIFTGHVNNFRHKGYDRWHVEFSNFESHLLEDVTVDFTDDTIFLDEIVEEIIEAVSRDPGIDLEKKWEFIPEVEEGDEVSAGDILGTVEEGVTIDDKVRVPPDSEGGEVTAVESGEFTVEETVVELDNGEEISMHHGSRYPAGVELDNIELDATVDGVDRVTGVTQPDGGFAETPEGSTGEYLELAQGLGQQFAGIFGGPLGMGGRTALNIQQCGIVGPQPVTTRMKYHRENERAAELLDELATFADAKWWVDAENVFHFGKPDTEESDGLLDPQERKLLFVTDTDAGWLTPPYNSVVVIADGVVGEEGWGSEHLISNENPVIAARIPSPGADENEIIPNEIEEPVFTYKNKDINSPEQANNVAISLAADLAEQLEGGAIQVVGRPDIQLLDVVLMPDHLTPSGEEYAYSVGGVVHKLDPQNGFTTEIQIFHMLGLDNEVTNVKRALEFQRDEDEDEGPQPDDTVIYRGTEMTRKQRDLLRGTGGTDDTVTYRGTEMTRNQRDLLRGTGDTTQ